MLDIDAIRFVPMVGEGVVRGAFPVVVRWQIGTAVIADKRRIEVSASTLQTCCVATAPHAEAPASGGSRCRNRHTIGGLFDRLFDFLSRRDLCRIEGQTVGRAYRRFGQPGVVWHRWLVRRLISRRERCFVRRGCVETRHGRCYRLWGRFRSRPYLCDCGGRWCRNRRGERRYARHGN